MKRVFAIQTYAPSVVPLQEEFKRRAGDVELLSILDDSILMELKKEGNVTPGIRERLCTYLKIAEKNGADLVLVNCVAIGNLVEECRGLVHVPIVRIEEGVLKEAAKYSGRIRILARTEASADSALDLLKKVARPDAVLSARVVSGDLKSAMVEEEKNCDVLVLVQPSMENEEQAELSIPVLSCMEPGLKNVWEALK